MYWLGLALALTSGLFSINLFRNFIQEFIPKINDNHFDRALIIFLISGLCVTTVKYLLDQHEIKDLTNKIDLMEYQEVAAYNAKGNKSAKVIGVPVVPTPIDDWNNDFISRNEGKIIFKCNSSAINKCKLVIEKLPSYPFAYYFLAMCLKENGDQSWIQYAKKPKSIFEKTTKIPNHHSNYDLILAEIDKLSLCGNALHSNKK